MTAHASNQERPGADMDADALARRTFYVTLVGCVAFALAVFAFVL